MEFRRHTLPNGMEVLAEVNPGAQSLAMGFFVQTGARDETADVAGVSHFLEHMVFKGSGNRSGDDVNREFDEMGAHYNAFTSEENTVYYASVLPEFQTRTTELLADLMRPALRKEDFDTEKQVIIEEISMYEDQPPFGADDRARAVFFGKHPLGQSVLGTAKSVGDLPVEQMRAYFERRYGAANLALVATGKVDFDLLVADATRLAGAWDAGDPSRPVPAAQPNAALEMMHRESATQQYVMQLAAGPGASDKLRFAAKVLATVLGDDSGSRLYWELTDPGLAESASMYHYDYIGAGVFWTYLACSPEETAANVAIIERVYRQTQAEGITAAELGQAKCKINSRVVLGSEKPRGRLFTVGGNWVQRREYRSIAQDLEMLEAVTLEDVEKVLRDYPLSKCTTVAVGPLEKLTTAGA